MDAINSIDVNDVGMVILNFMTSRETAEMVISVKKYYPDLKIVIVDNGSSIDVINHLKNITRKHSNISLVALKENTGFARGNNVGIKELRKFGYEYIICSNNDMLFEQPGIIETLKYHCIQADAAVAGPRIVNLNNQDQNPLKINRFSLNEARSYYRRACWIPNIAFPILNLWRSINQYIGNRTIKQPKNNIPEEVCEVYALHGSFILFSPLFFKYYNGFDSNTFLYCEEYIIAEMIFDKDLKAVFVPDTKVVHKEDKTIDFVWGVNSSKQIFKYKKRAVRYWFKYHYLK